jgi:predicted porin
VGTGASQYSGGSDTNFTVGVGYTFGFGLSLRGAYSESEYEVSTTGNMKVKGAAVYGDWRIAGPHTVRLAYAYADTPTGNTSQNVGVYKTPTGVGDAGGENFTLAYSYAFSKRTEGSIAYNEMKNDARGTFSLGKSAATVGGKQTAMGIVLRHRF